ncbi:hypothetical protein SAMN04489740_2697 [Arthrobacter alpinus]|uniref:Uncharacterized protein n=1 Tax=Arthrobacter alpinus TaxID=656366 RepID=A0A1H5M0S6_9MICC|nr:hypothetical protein [Arthrobacter alpinus]SEE82842.1 hypothetical protein SAMN04489740_2697 [Arthrobacter alpinus]
MAITVNKHPDLDDDSYSDGTNWVIDDDGRLHVVSATGNLASYNANQWASAKRVEVPVPIAPNKIQVMLSV